MKGFISAIQFITRLPVGKPGTFEPERMVPFFPVVGLMIGALLALFDLLVSQIWSRPVASVLDVTFLVWITGAFHLDGLGDMADGLYGNRPRERALEIMKDSRIGAMALVTVICALAIKWGGMADMGHSRGLFLLIIPALSRGSMLFGFRFMNYGRPEGGTGHDLFERKLELADFRGVAVPVALAFLAGWRGLVLLIAFAAITAAILLFYRKRMGCITGDMLGAMTEITESALFLAAAMGGAA
ncbi:adenosylcobinamide-GDP ribazoletransferase [Desulfonema ishimotonii]|uniref:Adenosylcobinamide-GDP ribazoletransferase n=1 Tax=Desulfonema ishimotonii TaxID=45657 RepID=A0A401G2X0_9BACT|nr:adenosylcobinamide-GDP ribazoletransferase [Desulfonema ishimotonii]GBC63566.1 adenosylcobinamide-GDP ribazoletransferase [Desulfonema ishimotonii]